MILLSQVPLLLVLAWGAWMLA
uniref:Uncharacterized protein n=1 Tax=Arundo donax TaxID=35708 RepID=A0A0A9H121_ARUDO